MQARSCSVSATAMEWLLSWLLLAFSSHVTSIKNYSHLPAFNQSFTGAEYLDHGKVVEYPVTVDNASFVYYVDFDRGGQESGHSFTYIPTLSSSDDHAKNVVGVVVEVSTGKKAEVIWESYYGDYLFFDSSSYYILEFRWQNHVLKTATEHSYGVRLHNPLRIIDGYPVAVDVKHTDDFYVELDRRGRISKSGLTFFYDHDEGQHVLGAVVAQNGEMANVVLEPHYGHYIVPFFHVYYVVKFRGFLFTKYLFSALHNSTHDVPVHLRICCTHTNYEHSLKKGTEWNVNLGEEEVLDNRGECNLELFFNGYMMIKQLLSRSQRRAAGPLYVKLLINNAGIFRKTYVKDGSGRPLEVLGVWEFLQSKMEKEKREKQELILLTKTMMMGYPQSEAREHGRLLALSYLPENCDVEAIEDRSTSDFRPLELFYTGGLIHFGGQ